MAEAFLEHAGRVKQFVGNDGVEHAHATFVKHAHDGLLLLELARQALAELLVRRRKFQQTQIAHMALVVRDHALLQPLAQAVLEKLVGENSRSTSEL